MVYYGVMKGLLKGLLCGWLWGLLWDAPPPNDDSEKPKGEALERRTGPPNAPPTPSSIINRKGEALERRTGRVRGGGCPPRPMMIQICLQLSFTTLKNLNSLNKIIISMLILIQSLFKGGYNPP